MEKVISLVKPEKEKIWWKLEDVELNSLETAIFNGMLNFCAIGLKTFEELKDMGNVKMNRKGSYIVEFNVSNEKRACLLFGRKWEKYQYRCASFSKNKVMGIDN